MNKLIGIVILLLVFNISFSQSVVPIRADTVRIYKAGGSAEFRLENSTKTVTGIAVNVDGKGTLGWVKPYVSNDTLYLGSTAIKLPSSGGGWWPRRSRHSYNRSSRNRSMDCICKRWKYSLQ
jgi:hypothetical protein